MPATFGAANEATAVAALFADGYAEGGELSLEALVADVEQRREALAYWADVFTKVPDASRSEVMDYLVTLRAVPESG